MKRRAFILATGGAAMALPRLASAQSYPARTVRMIVPFAPGGQTYLIGRLLAQHLSEHFGQHYYVENKPGAGGNIGAGLVAQAAPDGYTMLVTDGMSFVANPNLYDTAPYDPFKDFAPVSLAVTTTQVLTVNPSLPARNVGELVALLKAEPGKYSFGSAGIGTPAHLTSELLRRSAGVDFIHVPFGGASQAVASTVAGHTPIAFASPAASLSQIAAGKLRALAVASKARIPVLPDVPTMAEAGFPDVECDVWVGAVVPARTPQEIVALLHAEIGRIVTLPEVKARLAEFGFVAYDPSLQDAAARLRDESAKWAAVIRAIGLKAR